MSPRRPVEVTPHTFIGVSLALLGVVLTLDNLGFVDAHEVVCASGRSSRSWSAPPTSSRRARRGTGCSAPAGSPSARRSCCATSTSSASVSRDFLPLLLVALGPQVHVRPRPAAPTRWPGMRGSRASRRRPRRRRLPPFAPVGEAAFPPRFDGAGDRAAGQARRRARRPARAPGRRHGGTPGHDPARVRDAVGRRSPASRRRVAHVEVSAVMGGCDIDLRDADADVASRS